MKRLGRLTLASMNRAVENVAFAKSEERPRLHKIEGETGSDR